MKLFRKYGSLILRLFIFIACVFFLFSGFEFKLAAVRSSYVIEFLNKDFHTDLNEIQIDGYTFYYDNDQSKNDISLAVNILNQNKELALDSLNPNSEPTVKIRILSKFNDSHSDSLGYVYFHNNIINILNTSSHKKLTNSSSAEADNLFSETLMHEYTHSVINEKLRENKIYPKKLPLWFNEGIAEYIGKKATSKFIPLEVNSSIRPSELNSIIENNTDLFYKQSSVFINSLVTLYGHDSISTVIENLKNNSFEKSLEISTKKELDDLSISAFNTFY